MTQAAPTLDQWYTIRHSLALLMNKLINEENPDSEEELERQRIEECIYTQNLQAKVNQIIAAEEKRLGVTPIPPGPYDEQQPAPTTQIFTRCFALLANHLHADNVKRGFWDESGVDRNNGELIALMHSELSEALEALRHNNPPSDHIAEFSGVEEELADCIIRIMDMAAARGYRVAEALIAKVEFNRSRPHKHGKQF